MVLKTIRHLIVLLDYHSAPSKATGKVALFFHGQTSSVFIILDTLQPFGNDICYLTTNLHYEEPFQQSASKLLQRSYFDEQHVPNHEVEWIPSKP